jgi:hypothetical protein
MRRWKLPMAIVGMAQAGTLRCGQAVVAGEGQVVQGPEMPAWVAALRPSEIPLWVSYAGSLALILMLYAVKFLVLRQPVNWAAAVGLFVTATAIAVPGTYLLASDWGNPNVAPTAIYVGNPIASLGVPCASFAWDWATREPGRVPWGRAWRTSLELLIGVPLWVVCWIYIEFLGLGWIWI